jgi:hypothetical protein
MIGSLIFSYGHTDTTLFSIGINMDAPNADGSFPLQVEL